MKRVLHQEWLEEWLSGVDIAYKHCYATDQDYYEYREHMTSLDMFNNPMYEFIEMDKLD